MSITRFMILAHARSGSSALMLALRQHPAISMLGEVFHKNGDFRIVNDQSPGADSSIALNGNLFLAKHVFRPPSDPRKRAIGFKILYTQARSPAEESAWNFLQKNRDIKVIHLYRTNLLETLTSLQLALRTGDWFQTSSQQSEVPAPIVLDPGATKEYFDQMRSHRRWAVEVFRRHHVLKIDYTLDLHARFNHTLETAQSFLQVPFHPLESPLRKQAQAPPSKQIANYAELKEYFADTPYHVFFEA